MSSAKSFHETFYGTPTEDESRRRRGKKRHKKGVKEEPPQNEVAVIGVHYRSFDDDSMAAFVNSATALVPWNGDSKLLIDRYDVRHLLQDLTGIRRRRARPPSPDATKEELDYERYRDVEGLENPSPHEDELKNGDDTGGGYQRVGFDYGTGDDHATRKERVEDVLFSPPFFVPEHLRTKIPTSTKVHQIMAGTAKYVIEHGGQAEIVLRVKQANNPTFGFLMPDHYDHEYFRFLVAHPEHVGIPPTLPPQEAAVPEATDPASSEEAEGGLSLLGTAYGDADEDDEEEGKEGEVVKNPPEQPQLAEAAAADDLEKVEDGKKEQVDCNSEHGATSKRSSTPNLTATDGAENATKDTGDSLEVARGSERPESAGQSGEVPADGMIGSSSGPQEPAPPGMEASCSGAAAAEGLGQAGGLDDQVVPPYKEPPNRLRLIINKMVEFIARNGKEFEAIVKERDKTDHRFPFFLPWNEYHPYFAKELDSARQAQLSSENGVAGTPSASEPPNPVQSQEVTAKGEVTESFLNGVPFWDISQAAEANGGANDGEGGMADTPESEEDKSHNGEGGMDFDAVLAAVRAATRGRPQSAESNPESHSRKASDGNEAPEIGSDEAVLAAIRAATGRTKLDSSGSVTEKEISHLAGPSGPAATDTRDPAQSSTAARIASVGDMRDPPQTSTLSRNASVGGIKDPFQTSTLSRNASVGGIKDSFQTSTLSRLASVADSNNPIGTAAALPQSNAEAPVGSDEGHEVVSRAVTKAASDASPGEERDSAEPRLTTPEKRKAERLKKAKLFAAMIKDKNGSLTNPAAQLSPSLGTSAPNLDRLNHVFVALESTTLKSGGEVPAPPIDIEPETRDPTGDTQVHAASEADKELVDASVKQRKHKVKSKDHEERKRKHHHKRKKDTEERENESKHSPSTGERRKDKHHDHYQDAKRKERKHGREAEERKAKDSSRQKDGKFRSDEGFKDRDDWTDEEYDEPRKNRSRHTHDTEYDGRRKASKYGYEAEEKKRRDRHEQDSEGARKESRHGYDSEEERRLARHKYDADRKRKDSRRHRHDSEERRSADRYDHDSDGARKERDRRHGKRKKDIPDESDDKDSRRNEHRTKKSKLQGDESAHDTESAHVERPGLHHRDPEDDVKVGFVSPVKLDATLQTSTTQARVGEVKSSTLSSADVPDDIRAKVRAMLAMM